MVHILLGCRFVGGTEGTEVPDPIWGTEVPVPTIRGSGAVPEGSVRQDPCKYQSKWQGYDDHDGSCEP